MPLAGLGICYNTDMGDEAKVKNNEGELLAIERYRQIERGLVHAPMLKKEWSEEDMSAVLSTVGDPEVVRAGLEHVRGRELCHVLRLLRGGGDRKRVCYCVFEI